MRKAAVLSKRGSRKKQPQGPPPPEPKEDRHNGAVSYQVEPPPPPPPPPPPVPMDAQHRRKPSAEETALTSKNYRLAKELSELRVRYREECKNVTRLTMENMSLASRCRESISHVAMLKKELAMHQRRANEALAFQREQTQRMASNLSAEVSRLSQSGSEDDDNMALSESSNGIMERLLAQSTPVSQPGSVLTNARGVSSPKRSGSNGKDETRTSPPSNKISPLSKDGGQKTDTTSDMGDDAGVRPGRSTLSPNETKALPALLDGKPHRMAPDADKRNSDETGKSSGDVEEDGNFGEPKSLTLFPVSASPKPYSPREYNEEFPSDVIAMPHRKSRFEQVLESEENGDAASELPAISRRNKNSPSRSSPLSPRSLRRDPATLSSIDAFEASFDTTFPDAFSLKEGDDLGRDRPSSGTYNPFSPSPARSMGSGYEGQSSSQMSSVDPSQPRTPDRNLTSSTREIEQRYMTPPHSRHVPESDDRQPKRPEKNIPDSARAKYEKAMQPRSNGSSYRKSGGVIPPSLSIDPHAEPIGDHSGMGKSSPPSLLHRLHKRRMKQYMQRQNASDSAIGENDGVSSSSKSLDNLGDSSRSLSERPFDELEDDPLPSSAPQDDRLVPISQPVPTEATSTILDTAEGSYTTKSSRLHALKLRRSVKQPISYAEPPLNTKLRRGDTYFTKAGPPAVTPEARSPSDPVFI